VLGVREAERPLVRGAHGIEAALKHHVVQPEGIRADAAQLLLDGSLQVLREPLANDLQNAVTLLLHLRDRLLHLADRIRLAILAQDRGRGADVDGLGGDGTTTCGGADAVAVYEVSSSSGKALTQLFEVSPSSGTSDKGLTYLAPAAENFRGAADTDVLHQHESCEPDKDHDVCKFSVTTTGEANGPIDFTHLLYKPKVDIGPPPLIIYTHGWGGDATEGKPFAETAVYQGMAVALLNGDGPPGFRSWNAVGSSSSPGTLGRTCEWDSPNYCWNYDVSNGGSCDCSKSDGCWWSTCIDSTKVILDAVEAVKGIIEVDPNRIWHAGCSNGAMMVYQNLHDPRSADIFTGGVAIVGLPDIGFPFIPASPVHFMGIWGSTDTTMPPLSNTDDPDISASSNEKTGGWLYRTARYVTSHIAIHQNASSEVPVPPGPDETINFGGVKCLEYPDVVKDVFECVFPGGHVCAREGEIDTAINFIMGPRYKFETFAPTASPVISKKSDAANERALLGAAKKGQA